MSPRSPARTNGTIAPAPSPIPITTHGSPTFGDGSDGMRSLTAATSQIGVITIAGDISDGNAGPGEAGAARIAKLLDDALDDDLAALVVRVDSPGGTITGSEAIRRAILRQKAKGIPVAVSMGSYAASGGYWVSTSADRIFAEPETITGSIGVILAWFHRSKACSPNTASRPTG